MTRSIQSRPVSGERQGGQLAIARALTSLEPIGGLNRRTGVAGRDRTADVAELAAACRTLSGARPVRHVEDQIRRVVDAAPPLTAEQRDTLALLLRGVGHEQPLPPSTSAPM